MTQGSTGTAPPAPLAGEMSALVRDFDWGPTSLGPREAWPAELRAVTEMLLAHPLGMILLWGPELAQVYNDAYRAVMAGKHPGGLGQPTRECWPEVWHFTAPICARVMEQGETVSLTEQRLVLQRHGTDEETFFDLTYSPVRMDSGAVGGVLVTVIETTERVLAERRVQAYTQRLEQEAQAQAAFVAYQEAVGGEQDVLALVQQASRVLRGFVPQLSVAYYELEGDLWRARAWSENLSPEITAQLTAGLPLSAPNFKQAAATGEPLFVDAWDAAAEGVPSAAAYGTAALVPLVVRGRIQQMFSAGSVGVQAWTPREQALVRAVARGLGLTLERTEHLRQLDGERAALRAFADFTEQSTHTTDAVALAEAARDVLVPILNVEVGYSELDDGLWKGRVFTAGTPADVREQALRGFPADLPSFARPFEERDVVFVDGWDAEAEGAEHTGSYGATAFYPYFDHGRPWGLLTMGTAAARTWTGHERSVFRSVGRSLRLALERAEHAQQLEIGARAQAAFVAFTEAVGTETDVAALTRRAVDLLGAQFHDGSAAAFERVGDLWRAQAWSADLPADLVAAMVAGLPQSPVIAEALRTREAVFVDAWDVRGEIEHSEGFGAVANVPLLVGGEVRGLLGLGRRNARRWTVGDQATVRAVGRGLTLALERAEAAAQLAVQNAELDARARALEEFARLTQDLATQEDQHAFVRRAQEVVVSLLPRGYARYYERAGGRWVCRAQVGEVGNAALQAYIDAGPPAGQTPSLDLPWETGAPLYQDAYARGSDTPPELVQNVGSVASLPVVRRGTPVGLFVVALFDARAWKPTDKVVLEAVVRALEGALERMDAARELNTAQMRLRAVINNAPLVLFALNRDGVFTLSEGRGLEALGLQAGQAVGLSAHDLYGDHPELLDDLRVAFGGVDVHQTRRIGERTFETWTIPVRDAHGEVCDIVGVSTDVTERQRAERDLAHSNAELRRSNTELEQFAYVASHDLQAPIRAVTSFAELLDRKYGAGLDDPGRRYLRQIVDSGEHMKRLIDDLLAYSRVHTEQRTLGPVDAGAVFDRVAERLRAHWPGATITRGDLPTVRADAQQLDQLLQNLMSNGLKYRREDVSPTVHIQAEREGPLWRFSVRDNGIGIESEYFERIFVIFQRLHGRQSYDGTGIGLAVCKKIVEGHGGQMWVQSVPGEGSTFSFTLRPG